MDHRASRSHNKTVLNFYPSHLNYPVTRTYPKPEALTRVRTSTQRETSSNYQKQISRMQYNPPNTSKNNIESKHNPAMQKFSKTFSRDRFAPNWNKKQIEMPYNYKQSILSIS